MESSLNINQLCDEDFVIPPLGVRSYNDEESLAQGIIIKPYAPKYRNWEMFMALVIAYSSFSYSFEVALLASSPILLLTIIDGVIDFFLVCDIVLTFFVAYRDSKSQLYVLNRRRIACRYLRTWLIVDLISTVPLVLGYSHIMKKELSFFSYMVILGRFFRFRKVHHLFTRLEKYPRLNYRITRCAKLLCGTIYVLHLNACMLYMLADLYPRGRETWIGTSYPNFRERSPLFRYCISVYAMVTTITTVGYGDLHAVNTRECVFFIFIMLFSIAFGVYLATNIHLLLKNAAPTMDFRAKRDLVHRLPLPSRLKDRIFAHMRLQHQVETLNEIQLMEQMPPSIRRSMCEELFLPTVEKVYLFNGVSRETLFLLVVKMKPEYISSTEDVIVPYIEEHDYIYIIVSGEVEMIDEDNNVIRSLIHGDIFGEDGALLNRPSSFTYRTKTICQLLRLQTITLVAAMQSREEDKAVILMNFHQKRYAYEHWITVLNDEACPEDIDHKNA